FLASVRDISESQRARQTEVRARYDALVARLGQLALESPDGSSVLDSVPALLAETLGIEAAAILLPRASGEGLEIRALHAQTPAWRETLEELAGLGATLPALVGEWAQR